MVNVHDECRDDLNTLVSYRKLAQETGVTEKPEFYNPEVWRTRYLACPYPITKVEFSSAEQTMINQLAAKLGCSRMDAVRLAVQYAYDAVVKDGEFKCVEKFL